MARREPEPASECIKCSEGRHEICLRHKGHFCRCSNQYHERGGD